jgi:multiple sugar transport system ATP-binding protein
LAQIEQKDGRVMARFDGGSLALPERAVGALGGRVAGEVIIGVRPEDLYESAPPGEPGQFARLPALVRAVEALGAETLLMTSLEGSTAELTARIGRDATLQRGDRIELTVDTVALHLFDPVTTNAIV